MKFIFLPLLATVALAATEQARFKAHTIATNLNGGHQVVLADLNHDGRPDIIAVASGPKELLWFQNPTWKRHLIAGNFKGMAPMALALTEKSVKL